MGLPYDIKGLLMTLKTLDSSGFSNLKTVGAACHGPWRRILQKLGRAQAYNCPLLPSVKIERRAQLKLRFDPTME